MANPRETRTNAADSAPGVDDGPAGVPPPPVNSKPGGRRAVWIGVIVVCLVVLVAFLVRPLGTHPKSGSNDGTTAQGSAAATTAQPGGR